MGTEADSDIEKFGIIHEILDKWNVWTVRCWEIGRELMGNFNVKRLRIIHKNS